MNETAGLAWLALPITPPDETYGKAAAIHQASLTKPPGSLGQLETIAVQLAAMQATERPTVDRVHITVFAGDHGIAAEGVSAFPQEVTVEMVHNFAKGGAAISVLANQLQAQLEVINLGTVVDPGPLPGVIYQPIGQGTANFCKTPAMRVHQFESALDSGRQSVERAIKQGVDLFIGGEMGIGNTTAATALVCALTGLPIEQMVGPGTGLNSAGISHKSQIIKAALDLHKDHISSPIDALVHFGGFEIAALVGAYLSCAQMGVPMLVDGFIASAAALVATEIHSDVVDWLLFAHASAEPGHQKIMQTMEAKPILDIGMRLGEGSGAAVAVPLLRLACALHNNMATFAEAQVSAKL